MISEFENPKCAPHPMCSGCPRLTRCHLGDWRLPKAPATDPIPGRKPPWVEFTACQTLTMFGGFLNIVTHLLSC